MARLIGLHGVGQVGKDSIADLFVERYGFVKLAFATPLYQEVADAYDVEVDDLASSVWKTKPLDQLAARNSRDPAFIKVVEAAGYYADEPLTSRKVLELWGNDYKKAQNGQDYYAAKMIGRLRALPGADIVFSDIRHDIEACVGHWSVSMGRYTGFQIVEILRHGTVSTGHSSDLGLSKFLINATVRNNSTVEACFEEINAALSNNQQVRTNG